MAQEVGALRSDAAVHGDDGYLRVAMGGLGAWAAAHDMERVGVAALSLAVIGVAYWHIATDVNAPTLRQLPGRSGLS
jgi:hypothetical protein